MRKHSMLATLTLGVFLTFPQLALSQSAGGTKPAREIVRRDAGARDSTAQATLTLGEPSVSVGTAAPKAAVKFAAPPAEPTDITTAAKTAQDALAAAKAGRWWYFSALALMITVFILKFFGTKIGFWEKLGRWRYAISPILSLTAALLAAFQGGASIEVVMGVFTSSYATSSLQELWEHGILGKPRKSAVAEVPAT